MKHQWNITIALLILFFTAHIIGLIVMNHYYDPTLETQWKELPDIMGVNIETPETEPQYSILYVITGILLGTALIFLIIKYGSIYIWKIWIFAAIAFCLHVAFGAWLPPTIALTLAVIAAGIKIFKPNPIVHNLTELFIYGGLATVFVRILDIKYTFILLLVISVYDAYAVWKSKHMVELAKFQTQSGVFAGLLIPYKITTTKTKTKITTKTRSAVLGGGDIGFTLLFSGTVLAAQGFLDALIVSTGATIALFALLVLGNKDKFYPAMPFLTAGVAIGYLITLL